MNGAHVGTQGNWQMARDEELLVTASAPAAEVRTRQGNQSSHLQPAAR
jgi:hypothetical protein